MKKVLLIIAAIILLLVITGFLYLGAPYDPDQSEYQNLNLPDVAGRTIENHKADYRTTFLETADETNGEYTLLEVELAPGGGNNLHYHGAFTEAFTPVSGTLAMELENEEYMLEEGETLFVDFHEVHRYYNPDDEPVTFTVRIEPGSPGFEKALHLLYGLANDGLTDEEGIPKDIHHTALFVELSDTRIPGLRGSFFSPVFSRLAGRAQRQGIEETLLEKYYVNWHDNSWTAH